MLNMRFEQYRICSHISGPFDEKTMVFFSFRSLILKENKKETKRNRNEAQHQGFWLQYSSRVPMCLPETLENKHILKKNYEGEVSGSLIIMFQSWSNLVL